MKQVSVLMTLLPLSLSGCLCNSVEEAIKERVAEEVVDRISTDEKKTGQALEVLRNMVKTKETIKQVEVALTESPTVPVVNWRKLEPFLPDELGDFSSDKELKGKTATMGDMKATTVKRRYKAGKRSLKVEIIDTSMAPMLRAGFAMMKAYSEDSTEGVKKAIKVAGNPAMLDWRKKRSRGELNVLVAGRFMIKLTLRPCEKPEEVVAVAKKIDMAKLAKVKAD